MPLRAPNNNMSLHADSKSCRIAELEAANSELRDNNAALEQQCMFALDQYAALAEAIGATVLSWWGDPSESHSEVLRMARDLRAIAKAEGR